MAEGIEIERIAGLCPVQGEGTIDGYPFYFRERGRRWGIYISMKSDLDPVDVRGSGPVPGGWKVEGFSRYAGYMPELRVRALIVGAAKRFRKHHQYEHSHFNDSTCSCGAFARPLPGM